MPDASNPPPLKKSGPNCRKCGYVLGGLDRSGHCPECGTAYPPFWVPPKAVPAPTICLRLGWPIAGMAFCGLLLLVGGNSPGSDSLLVLGGLGLAAMVLATIINTPVQLVLLAQRHAPPGRKSGSFLAHLAIAGQVAVVTVLVLTATPIVLFAACLYAISH